MNPYSLYYKGSTWSKWDLHVHTPNTKLSDCYKTEEGTDAWEKFVTIVEESDVDVIGITDYFSIDNYVSFLELHRIKYPDSKKVFFPNIEFRLDVSVNKNAEQVDIHIIFDNHLPIDDIRHFLMQLPSNILQNATKIPCGQLTKQQIKTAAINYDELRKCLLGTFGNRICYIIGAATNNQGLRADTQSSRKINISENIERCCNFLFGNSQTKEHYLQTNRYANGDKSDPKPVISGSDAHSFNDLAERLGKGNYCTWIKAIPTFNGLRQIIFEPEYRVAIQIYEPDYKQPHNIISSIRIHDETSIFGNRIINLNKNLNTIIGGKSSGKSLLLYFLANSIDSEHLRKIQEKFKDFLIYTFEGPNFAVEWADGIIDSNNDGNWEIDDLNIKHKITYIPQLYINYLAEKNGKEELNQLINEILLENSSYKLFKDDLDEKIREINNNINNALESLFYLRNNWFETTEERKKYATQEVYEDQIKQLTWQYSQLNTKTILAETELNEYTLLTSEKNVCETKITKLSNNKIHLSQIRNEIIQNYSNLVGDNSRNIVGSLSKYFSKINSEETNVTRIVDIILEGYRQIISNYDKEFSNNSKEEEIGILEKRKNEIESKLATYNDRLAKKSELPELLQKIERAKNDKAHVIELESRKATFHSDYMLIKNNISEMLNKRTELYSSLATYINTHLNDMGSGINLNCTIYYPLISFGLYEKINKQYAFNSIYLKNLFDENAKILKYSEIPSLFSNLSRIEGNTLCFSDKSTHQLRSPIDLDTAFKYLIQDNFAISYDVKYKGDNLIKMSPGKKGTVLLILFLELSSSENPILIDQPEDNLDNRTIYDLLGKMIKNKKKSRQIIIVTHNANLVVNTDAENVIVANQEGQDPSVEPEKKRTKFEYINGPIELSFRNQSSKGILTKMGIKQHICDILEGGEEAFKLRELKYKEELNI